MAESTCPRCAQRIGCEDNVDFDRHGVFHPDCGSPHDLSSEERALLFTYCWHDAVARCTTCGRHYRQQDLYADFLGARTHRCPCCRTDLTDCVRVHLFACALVPGEVRRRAAEAREAARRLVKQSQQLSDSADVLMREAEGAVAALRETMRRIPIRMQRPQS